MFTKLQTLLMLVILLKGQEDIVDPKNCFELYIEDQSWQYSNQDQWKIQYPSCGTGFQSPINLLTNDLALRRNKLKFENDIADGGWTVTVNKSYHQNIQIKSNHSAIQLVDVLGQLKRYHSYDVELKFPSEHTLNGLQFDGELQIQYLIDPQYCSANGNQVAFLSLFLMKDNVPDDPFFTNLLSPNTSLTNFDFRTNLTSFLKSFYSSYIQYNGSQTHPQIQVLNYNQSPCAKAYWNILTTPKRVNLDQLSALSWTIKGQKRNLQIKKTPHLDKGTFVYYVDDIQADEGFDDIVTWASVWAAPLAICFALIVLVLVYGIYKLSNAQKSGVNTKQKFKTDQADEQAELQVKKNEEIP